MPFFSAAIRIRLSNSSASVQVRPIISESFSRIAWSCFLLLRGGVEGEFPAFLALALSLRYLVLCWVALRWAVLFFELGYLFFAE